MSLFCSSCGNKNSDGGKFCVHCGQSLKDEKETAKTAYRQTAPMTASSNTVQKVGGEDKKPAIALLLSFLLAGIGQLYNGETKKGILMLAGSVIGGLISVGVIYFGVWIWSMIDAYNTAEKMSKGV